MQARASIRNSRPNTVTNRDVIGSGGTMTVSAVKDVNNIGVRIGSVKTIVAAGHGVSVPAPKPLPKAPSLLE
ncbi:hypothetical protein PSAC2689_170063 [Paraburkholderia sacchari]|uniref:hypothetical protein n=1 Tax=Paraburkholderia sacchari TaxID=159450 RepID=UPI0039A56496